MVAAEGEEARIVSVEQGREGDHLSNNEEFEGGRRFKNKEWADDAVGVNALCH